MYGLLNDAPFVLFVLLVLSCAAIITIGSIVTALVAALTRVRRTDFVRLQNEVRELSEHARALQVAEHRRLTKELNPRSKGTGPAVSPPRKSAARAEAARVVAEYSDKTIEARCPRCGSLRRYNHQYLAAAKVLCVDCGTGVVEPEQPNK